MLFFKSRWEFIPEGKNVSLGYCYCFLLVLFFACELFLATSNLIHFSSSSFSFIFFFNLTAGIILQWLISHTFHTPIIINVGM